MLPASMRMYILFLAGHRLDPQPPAFYGYLVTQSESYVVDETNNPIEYPTL